MSPSRSSHRLRSIASATDRLIVTFRSRQCSVFDRVRAKLVKHERRIDRQLCFQMDWRSPCGDPRFVNGSGHRAAVDANDSLLQLKTALSGWRHGWPPGPALDRRHECTLQGSSRSGHRGLGFSSGSLRSKARSAAGGNVHVFYRRPVLAREGHARPPRGRHPGPPDPHPCACWEVSATGTSTDRD
jgi:hypothetical protein